VEGNALAIAADDAAHSDFRLRDAEAGILRSDTTRRD
jgi:hypothetical protein